MTTSFPGALDTLTNPVATDPLTGHAQLHSDVNDAVEAIEAKLGTGSSAATGASDGDVLTADGAGGSAWAPAGGGGLLQKATVTLTSADILALNTTPVELVPSPGANKWIGVHRLVSYYRLNTTAYEFSAYPIVKTGPITWGSVSFDSGDAIRTVAAAAWVAISPEYVVDTAVMLDSDGDSYAAGDGTLTVTVYYTVEDVPA